MILFAKGQRPGTIYVNQAENSAVLLAVQQLANDMEKVCGVRPAVVHQLDEQVVVMVGTLSLLHDAPICLDRLCDESGQPRWEAYLQQVKERRLWLVGSDRRGAVYAVYDFCEKIGVSPWYDMADVPVKHSDVISVPDDFQKADWPSVKYRGIFLNDEEELDAWARKHTADTTIGPATYEKIFELILRLKGNYIWPAMHVNAFNMNPENGLLAERMGMVTGTSHCDMLHRSNQNEWKPWIRAKGYDGLQYDYTIPGENRERLLEYWRESLRQNRDFEACYTIGMRGIHDSGFVTKGLDENASPEEQLRQKRALLEEIMQVQRQLIAQELPGRDVPQAFVPYKEVLPIYDSGLRVPEDVTLIWVDDNHGYMRRYPNEAEQQRSGGHGLYYHSSYWAPPGMSWLFMCSTPLSHMGNELKKCYEQSIRRIWVDNVGALKPIEQDMEYFLRCGWDAGKPDSVMLDARRFTCDWINRNFSGNHGEQAAAIYTEFAQLCNLCKPEHMRSDVFSQTAYGDEAGTRVWRMYELAKQAEQIWSDLPCDERDAFFQLFLMKMKAAFFIAASYYFADRSRAAYALGAMRAADENMLKSRKMDDLKRLLLYEYNHRVSGGRWSGILTPEEFPPPPLELYPACQPALRMGNAHLLVRLPQWGTPDCLNFGTCGQEKWVELFNAGAGSMQVTLSATEGIHLSQKQLLLESEARIIVRAEKRFEKGRLYLSAGEQSITIPVIWKADGFIHIRAEDCELQAGFACIADIGRGTGAVMEAAADTTESKPAWLETTFTTEESGRYELEIIRFLTLRSTGQIRLRLTLDQGWQQALASETRDEYTGCWEEAACRDGEKLSILLPLISAGVHTLRVEALDPYIALDCFNLYTQPKAPCMLGPGALPQRMEIPDYDAAELSRMFRARLEEVPPPSVPYCGDAFWQQDMLYARNELLQPNGYGRAKQYTDSRGHKDILATLYGGRIHEENGHLAWEAENALCQTNCAWQSGWTHRQAETDGRTGLAMWIPSTACNVKPTSPAPRLNYRIFCAHNAVYHLWLFMKYDDKQRCRCRFFMDGHDLHESAIVCRDRFHTYRTVYTWCWQKLVSVSLSAGEHIFAIEATCTGLAIDRLYMTTGNEYPPLDMAWKETREMEGKE